MVLSFTTFIKEYWTWFLDAYLVLFVVALILKFAFKNRKIILVCFVYLIIIGLYILSVRFDLLVSKKIYYYLILAYPIFVVILFNQEIKKEFETKNKKNRMALTSNSIKTMNEVVEACTYLSKKRIGALITIEKHNSLDQYASKAIIIDSEVSKELLINIFTPYTPLHDGAVIIRSNRIRCAGAYYTLTNHGEDIDKTTGSRHRAALGISEVTDSLTICVSEETGSISITTNGLMVEANDKDKLLEYLELFL